MLIKIVEFLDKQGLRCGKCSKWYRHTDTLQRKIEFEVDFGGILKMGPFYIESRVRTCECGHIMFSRFVGTVAYDDNACHE
ncbi:MAG: hypothetical protein WBL19_03090 [Minisyncoccia bacterium]